MASRVTPRVAALDGLRGLVIFFVVVNHAGGTLWPRGSWYETPVVAGLLGGGAVTVFFVVGALIVTRNLQVEAERGDADPFRFYLRRVVRLGVQLVPLCGVLLVVHLVDSTQRSTNLAMVHNIVHVLSYTQNQFVQYNFFDVRREFGHLWYLSVQQQCYALLPIVLVLFGRRPLLLSAALAIVAGMVYVHRQDVLDERGWIIASSLTTTRADGLIAGVIAALLVPLWRGRPIWRHVLWLSGAALIGLKLLLPELEGFAYLGPWSIAFTVVAGVVACALWSLDRPTRTSRALAWEPFRRVGRASLSIFIWHLPVIVVVARHTPDWSWPARTVLATLVLGAIVLFMERFVEGPTRHMLATKRVFRVRGAQPPPSPQPRSAP